MTSLPKREDASSERELGSPGGSQSSVEAQVNGINGEHQNKRSASEEFSGEWEQASFKGEIVLVGQLSGSKGKVFRCPKCLYTSSNSSHCVNHVRQHGSNKRYRCELCDYSLDKLPHIMIHMKTSHLEKMQSSEGIENSGSIHIVNGISGTSNLKKSQHKLDKKNKRQRNAKSYKLNKRMVKNALVQIFRKKNLNGLKEKSKVEILKKKHLHCRVCPYHTKHSHLLQNHLMQHNTHAMPVH